MKYIKNNEQGYTLVIVLLVIVLFMTIGAGLMKLNSSSVAKNENRQSQTQAQDLAVKGLDFVLKDIEKKVEDAASGGLTLMQFETVFLQVLDSYACDRGGNVLSNTETGTATYCIEAINPAGEGPLYREVTFRSTGEVKGRERAVTAAYVLGANSSDGYTLFTYQNGSVPLTPGSAPTGNIELHGGVQLYGNMYAHHQIVTSNSSRYKNTIVPSVFPVINGIPNSSGMRQSPILHQGGSGLAQLTAVGPETQKVRNDLATIRDEDYTLGYNKYFNVVDGQLEDIVEEPVTNTTRVDFKVLERIASMRREFYRNDGDTNPDNDTFNADVKPLKTGYTWPDYILTGGGYSNYALLSESRMVGGLLQYYGARVRGLNANDEAYRGANKVFVQGYDAGTSRTDENKFNWEVYGENNLNRVAKVAFPAELRLQYGSKTSLIPEMATNPVLRVKEAYIEKDMIVGLNNQNESNFNLFRNFLDLDALGLVSGLERLINFETPVHLEGTYYINGNLIISGAQLTGDATFFVKGNTTILFTDIGVNATGDVASSFNIISHGPIKVAYVGNNHNDNLAIQHGRKFVSELHASRFNGHLHSDQKISIDGASSNMYVEGSVTSREINISTIKGRTQPSCRKIGYYLDNHLIDGAVAPLLKDVLGIIVTERVAQALIGGLLDLLLGDQHADNDFNLVLDKEGTTYNSNCFEKVSGQQQAVMNVPPYLVNALGLQVIGGRTVEHPIVPRIQINYDPEPITELKNQFPDIQYDIDPPITQLVAPKEVRRN